MEEAPENGKESSHSAHAKGIDELINIKSWLLFSFGLKTQIFVKLRPQLPQKVSF